MKAQKANSTVALVALILLGIAAVYMITKTASTPIPPDATANLEEQIEGLDIAPSGSTTGS